MQHIGVGSHSTSSHTGQSQGLNSGRVELEAYVFCILVDIHHYINRFYRASKSTKLFKTMKKFMMVAIAMFVACVMNAQVKDQVQQSKDRAAKLEALCKD